MVVYSGNRLVDLFYNTFVVRLLYYHMLVRQRPKNSKYIKGWLNKVESCLDANI